MVNLTKPFLILLILLTIAVPVIFVKGQNTDAWFPSTPESPSNASAIITSNVSSMDFNFTLMNPGQNVNSSCWFNVRLWNGTRLGNYSMANDTTTHYFYNKTLGTAGNPGGGLNFLLDTYTTNATAGTYAYHNWTVFCNVSSTNSTGGTSPLNIINTSMMNGNASRWFFLLDTLVPQVVSPLNNYTYQNNPSLNITIPNLQGIGNRTGAVVDYLDYCWYNFTAPNGTIATGINRSFTSSHFNWANFSNISVADGGASPWRRKFGNITPFSTQNDTRYNQFFNLTFECNSTAFPSYGIRKANSTIIRFKVDTVNPAISALVASVGNITFAGNFLNITYNVSDENIEWDYATYFLPNGSVPFSIDFSSIGTDYTNGTLERIWINASKLQLSSMDGRYDFNITVRDLSQRNASLSYNLSYAVTNLKTGWNQISWTENLTLEQIAGRLPNITYVSLFNGNAGYKNFTTYQPGLAANSQIRINMTLNATYVYSSVNQTLIRPWNITQSPAIVAQVNQSLNSNGWNILSIVNPMTLNNSMYSSAYQNTSIDGIGRQTNSTWRNITYSSWYNRTSGMWCSAKQGFSITSCPGVTVTSLTMREGDVFWILVNANMSVNASAIIYRPADSNYWI